MKSTLLFLLPILFACTMNAPAQGTAFTYQGRLTAGGGTANGIYDLQFTIYDALSGGNIAGGPLIWTAAPVTNGLFTAGLEFGAGVFNGNARFLEVGVRTNGSASGFVALTPRQPITATPYAIFSSTAGSMNNGLIQNPAFFGTTGNTPLELFAGGKRALRLEPTGIDGSHSNIINVIAGSSVNFAAPGVVGATIAGGGAANYFGFGATNRVTDNFGTVGGGAGNIASNRSATVSGGSGNASIGQFSTVAGGSVNTSSGNYSVIGGGNANRSEGYFSTVGGGSQNISSGDLAIVPGGMFNRAEGYSSLAAGYRAVASHDGAFVWADRQDEDFSSTTENDFSIRAAGGVRISDSTPGIFFGARTRQTLNLLGEAYGIGVQPYTFYFRGDSADGGADFVWYRGGSHTDYHDDPGPGGARLMRLANNGDLQVTGDYYGRGHLWLHAYEGDGSSGTAYIQARDSSVNSSIGLQLRTQSSGAVRDALYLSPDGNTRVERDVNVDGGAYFGASTRQMLNLYNATFGIGVQNFTFYQRSDNSFAWYRQGTHSDTANDAGAGGTRMMTLDGNGELHVGGGIYAGLSLQNRETIGYVQNPPAGERWEWYVSGGTCRLWSNGNKMWVDTGGNLQTIGAVNPSSDRNVKENFALVDSRAVLDKIAELPIRTWNYTNDPSSRHIGPVAQDFHAAFSLGSDDKHIATVDADGVALAAIQGLNQKVEEQRHELKEKSARIEALEKELTALKEAVRAITAATQH